MTKREFIDSMKNMPDDAEVYFWNFEHLCWREAKPFYFDMKNHIGFNDIDENGVYMLNFIGIE